MPRLPGGEVTLQPPPEIPRVTPGNLLMKMLPVVMIVAMVGMMALLFTSGGFGSNPMSLLFPAMMMFSMVGMFAGQGGGKGQKASEANEDRKDYLRYLDQLRKDVHETSDQQRKALEWSHPDPQHIWTLAGSSRMWERRITDPDYCHVRVGRGSQRLGTRLIAPETGPVEELEPIASISLRRFVRAHSVVPDLPTAVSLRGFAAIALDGDREAARALVRSMLAQLCTFHGIDMLQVAVVCGPDTAPQWEWVKWLPHSQHPTNFDGVGPERMVYGSILELNAALGQNLLLRNKYSRSAPPQPGVPQVVIVVDGGILEADNDVITDGGVDSVTVIDLCGYAPRLAATRGLQLVVEGGEIGARSGMGIESFANVDTLSVAQAQLVARKLAPFPLPSAAGQEQAADEGETTKSWSQMIGVGELVNYNPESAWRPRYGRDRLRIAFGVGADGTPVELDIKEAAENGMGPHGLCIGATGSGKSEFLRTLVLGLIATHSPAQLNLVLVDFKGGATFLGLDAAPHVAAVITNLEDEADLVDRMKDALAGEMNRRQEVLRAAGNFANVGEYEKARAAGADLDPLPALFVVLDEFSELLTQHPDFAELFTMIGRLGRSLHVHILLASQRLDEGKMRGLESHLSYRIGLKTFSANESRQVLGVPDAFHLPGSPGAGYLKSDASEIVRFQASYVSGKYKGPRRSTHDITQAGVVAELNARSRPFTATLVPVEQVERPVAPVFAAEPEPEISDEAAPTTMSMIIDRIRDRGPEAHRIWLPPLNEPSTLDQLIHRSVLVEPTSPLATLRTPIGIVDRPYDQRRDPFFVDLSGSAGNVAIVGGPQSGKSTALRSLIMSMALTHSAEQVQFYCLDFGGGTLTGIEGLPHVGGVTGRLDADKVRRTVAEMTVLVRQREQRFRELGIESMAEFRRLRAQDPASSPAAAGVAQDPYGDAFLVVDGFGTIRQDFDALEQVIMNLAVQGLSYGVHVMITLARWGEVRPALKDQIGTRIELRLGDPSDSDHGRKVGLLVPEGRPGRGITREALHMLTALPRVDSESDRDTLPQGVADAVTKIRAATRGRPAPPVRMLPERIERPEVLRIAGNWPSYVDMSKPNMQIPIGIDEDELAPAYINFADQPHFLIFGDGEGGKTTLLRNIVEGIMASNSPDHAKIIVGDYRRTMLGVVEGPHLAGYAASQSVLTDMMTDLAGYVAKRAPGPDITQQQLREKTWRSPLEIYVVIDDYDLVVTSSGNPVQALVDYLPHAKDMGFHLIVARRTGGAGRAIYEPVLGRMRDLATAGLVMGGSKDEGFLIGNARPSELPPGRGTMVTRQKTGMIQTSWMPPL